MTCYHKYIRCVFTAESQIQIIITIKFNTTLD
jgi:hypothetical protein